MTSLGAYAARSVLAGALVLLGAGAHRAASHPRSDVRTVPFVTSPVAAAGGQLAVPVPDLAALSGSTVVLRGRIENTTDAPVTVEVRLNGFIHGEATARPRASANFAVVLRGGRSRALTSGVDGHRIDLVGRGDWRLAALDASTALATAGSPGLVVVVPDDVLPLPPEYPTLAVVLVPLAWAAIAWGVGFQGRKPALLHATLSAIAGSILAAAVIVPALSRWRLLVSTPIVWAAIALLFAPAIVSAIGVTGRAAARLRRYDEAATERGSIFFALCALVVALPIFEVVRASPEFFVARNTSVATAIGAAALLLVALPAALLAIECVLRRLWPVAATAFFASVIAVLIAALVHPWLTRAQVAGAWSMAGAAAAAGIAGAVAVWRLAGVREAIAALGPAALVVPLLFFGRTEVRESLAGWSPAVPAHVLARTPPIVFVVCDEFPLLSLLGRDHQIDAGRFPHFAALARDGTWYREATTVSSETVWAVPAIVSGRYPEAPGAVPTLRYYPGNLFTMLAGRYDITVFGRFLQLCPDGACRRDLEGLADDALTLAADLGIVWLHIVAPAPLAEGLPPVVGDWFGFARAGRFRNVDGNRVRNDRLGEFERFFSTITADPARLYFLHTLSPHMPFEYVQSGKRYDGPDYQGRLEREAGLFERADPAYADALHQRHLLQVGFVDTMIGRLVARLRALGIYDESLIVVTADHGASYREGVPRRAATSRNQADILRVPLFIKRPGQREGAVLDGLVESIDILPTVADALGTRLSFSVDGRSLDAPEGRRRSRAFIDRTFTRVRRKAVVDLQPSTETSLARRVARFGTGSLASIYAAPGTETLLGRQVDELPQRQGSVRVQVERATLSAKVDREARTLPLLVRGRFLDRSRPTLAVAVNGRIAATTVPFEERNASWFATMIPEEALRDGANDVRIFVVEGRPGRETLVATVP